MYVSVADDGSLNCWRNETGRARDASDHFDCANLLPLVSPQACDTPHALLLQMHHATPYAATPHANARAQRRTMPCILQRRSTCTNQLPPVASPPLRSVSALVYLLWQLSQLSEAAASIATTLLADWFRMDLFLGHPQLELRVNEITYPSHILDTGPLPQCLTPTLTPTLALSMSLTLPLTPF